MLIGTVLPIVGLLVALGIAALGAWGLHAGATTIRARIRSGRTEPRPVHRITPGGYVEAVGAVDDLNTDPITAPFSGIGCAAYEYRLLQQDGSTWRVAEGSDATEFVIESETGASAEVSPDGHSPNTEWETVATPEADASLPDQSREALRTHPAIDTDERPEYFAEGIDSARKYQERRLELDDEEVYAYGKATSGNVHDAIIDADRSSEFAIGTEPAGSFGGSYVRASVAGLIGVGLIAGGIYGGLTALELLGIALPARLPLAAAVQGGAVTTRSGVGFVGPAIAEGWVLRAVASLLPAATIGGVTVAVIFGGVLGAIGLVLAWRGVSGLWTAAEIFINQPVDPGEAAMLDGVVELEGTVRSVEDGAVESPYDGNEALLCEFRVRQQETERRRVTDSDGHTKTRRRTVWRTKATGAFERNFLVESGGERIEVDPSGAETTLGAYETIHQRPGGETLPEPTRLRLSDGGKRDIGDPASFLSQNASKKRRFQERTLEVGDSVHLYGGTVADESAARPLVVEGDEEYSIAAGTELRTVLRRSLKSLLALLVSLGFLGAGGYLLSDVLVVVL